MRRGTCLCCVGAAVLLGWVVLLVHDRGRGSVVPPHAAASAGGGGGGPWGRQRTRVAAPDAGGRPPPPPVDAPDSSVGYGGEAPESSLGALMEEHGLLLRVCDALDAFLGAACPSSGSSAGQRGAPGGAAAADTAAVALAGGVAAEASRFLAFFRGFGDEFHHGKEEGVVFAALAREGIARRATASLEAEHATGRAFLAAAAAAAGDCARMLAPARAYTRMLRAHIALEDGAVFPDAWASMPRGVLDAVDAACALVIPPPGARALGEELAARWWRTRGGSS